MQKNKIYTVSELNYLVKKTIDETPEFNVMLISGEIVNYKRHSSGHLYFSLKDTTDRIKCVMFSRQSRMLTFRPKDGTQVLIQGRLSVYTKSGEYQVYVDSLHPLGVGTLQLKYEELKKRLMTQGYFDEENKKVLPKIPLTIGVVTSQTGAAIHDIIRIIKSKFPIAKIVLAPASVQGENAALEIVSSIEKLNKIGNIDVMIVGRGGGATEELWAFNEEIVVKAVYNSQVPIISAVGHEVDTTLIDYVADKSAPTPTAAAEIAVPDIYELNRDIDYYTDKMTVFVLNSIDKLKQRLKNLHNALELQQPEYQINEYKQKLKYLSKSLELNFDFRLNKLRELINSKYRRLNELNPNNLIKNGLSIVYNDNGEIIKSIDQIRPNQNLSIVLPDGSFTAQVKEEGIKKNE